MGGALALAWAGRSVALSTLPQIFISSGKTFKPEKFLGVPVWLLRPRWVSPYS